MGEGIISRSWWSFLVRGLIAVAFGIIVLAWTGATVKTFIYIFGIFILLDGIVEIIRAVVFATRKEKWGLLLIGGLLGIIIGLIVLTHPRFALEVIVVLVGIWAILMGCAELAVAFELPPNSGRGWLGVLGALSIIVGVLILVYPFSSIYAVMVIIGIYAIIMGIADIVLAFYALGVERKLKAA